ncbi:allantoate amidohydrolase [Salmonella enterica subsp. enterica]|uniref:Allantoate amidohydrolase n=1 Tax=Salmonella enterica I TaxID=59201 RepID=A0A379WY01_SALET|nr:allantoate amidohydrolase [Salmonella enterica subsp. enterica]
MRAICDEMDISIDIDLWMDEAPVPMNAELSRPSPGCVKPNN